jgi:DNA (cytosine-5)-methyltransferase 1
MTASYYNEHDPYAAQWLRNLIAAELIPAGDVDERSIADVAADDLLGYTQCHFFAGIAGWSYAARLAGWPDDRELWTGSAPCQPFSVAGAQRGTDDERHLWPHFFRLIAARRPDVVMGEQVAAAVGKDWLDGVFADLEGIGYTCGAAVVPACAVDAPHRRDRLWFVADASGAGRQGGALAGANSRNARSWPRDVEPARRCDVVHADQPCASEERQQRSGELGGAGGDPGACDGDVADANGQRGQIDPHAGGCAQGSGAREVAGPGSAWHGAGWIIGHDGKARRVEPGIRLLAHGVSGRVAVVRTDEQTGAEVSHWYNRVGALRAGGNAIVPQVAAEVIAAFMECAP